MQAERKKRGQGKGGLCNEFLGLIAGTRARQWAPCKEEGTKREDSCLEFESSNLNHRGTLICSKARRAEKSDATKKNWKGMKKHE